MGTDIHGPFVEQQRAGEWKFVGEFCYPRQYSVFSLLAGVRYETAKSLPPKGIPKDISWRVQDKYLLWVSDEESSVERVVTTENARKWISRGICQVWEEKNGVPVRITNPDRHTPSWLGTEEVTKILRHCRPEDPYAANLMKAIHTFMKSLEKPDQPCRIVFWFDN